MSDVLDRPDTQISGGTLTTTELRDMVNVVEENEKVLVQMHMQHVKEYGKNPNMTLAYRWPGGPLEVGDFVECPGTALHPENFTGVVVAFGDGGYKGPCKTIIRRLPREEGTS